MPQRDRLTGERFRRRMIICSIISLMGIWGSTLLVRLVSEVARETSLLPTLLITVGPVLIFLASHYRRMQGLAVRIALYKSTFILIGLVASFGGLTGPTGPLLLVMPAVAALLLGSRDTVVTSALVFAALLLMVVFDDALRGTPFSTHTELLAVNTVILGASMLVVIALQMSLVREAEMRNFEIKNLLKVQTHQANHDALTALANRSAVNVFMAKLNADTDRLRMILIDLDGFKQVNDRLGHAYGDTVLMAVANKLRDLIRDAKLIARMGGDEFLVVIAEDEDHRSTLPLGDRLVAELKIEVEDKGVVCTVSASAGSAAYPGDLQCTADVLSKADKALYHAKSSGKSRYVTYESLCDAGSLAEPLPFPEATERRSLRAL